VSGKGVYKGLNEKKGDYFGFIIITGKAQKVKNIVPREYPKSI
jgi:hypothetical protein